MKDREEHEDREDDKTDQSESEEEEDDKVYVDDSAPPVETPYMRNSTEELGQVRLMFSPHYTAKWNHTVNSFICLSRSGLASHLAKLVAKFDSFIVR